MRYTSYLIPALILLSTPGFSQCGCTKQVANVLDGAFLKTRDLQREALPYPFLREADVMWSKRMWRVIDLNEKINLPFKYPLSKSVVDRCNLIDVIMDGTLAGCLTAYSPMDDEFTRPMTIAEVQVLGGGVDTIEVQNPNPPYDYTKQIIKKELKRDLVVEYRLKEEWFFDKQRSVMDVRIIGIAPIMNDFDEEGNLRGKKLLFWIYFPEARKLFAQTEVFNRQNDAERRTLDDIFSKRMFSSYIIKESNVYDRRVQDYRTGVDALMESEKIKANLIDLEHDVWEF
jgi:gliding motility associated protien GldN